MNREIKFRVWCKNKNEWEKDLTMITPDGVLMQEHYRDGIMPISLKTHIVQFSTGLKDKNGKEIYEGDIIEGGYLNPLTSEFLSRKYVVEYDKGSFKGKLIGYTPYGDTWLQFIEGEVIGNYYEDKHLLGRGKDGLH